MALSSVINKASKLLSSASVLRVEPSSGLRVNNNYNNCQPEVSNTTNQCATGTRMKIKNFEGIYYKGKIISDNEKWHNICYANGDQEEVTNTAATKIIAYSAISFTTDYSAALSAILHLSYC